MASGHDLTCIRLRGPRLGDAVDAVADPVGQAVGAGVVDHQVQAVGGAPDVLAGCGLHGAVPGVGLRPVGASGEGSGVVGAGLSGWAVLVVGGDVVVVEVAGEVGGVGEVLAGGGELDALADVLGIS